jgi:hypothetical protein
MAGNRRKKSLQDEMIGFILVAGINFIETAMES